MQFSLDILSETAALELLASYVGKFRIKSNSGKGFTTKITGLSIGEQICAYLGYLPLSIELLGVYWQQHKHLSLEKILVLLKKQQRNIALHDYHINLSASKGAIAVLELIWESLDEYTEELMYLCSLFALAPMPWEQIESVLGQIYLPGALLDKLMNSCQEDSDNEIIAMIEEIKKSWQISRDELLTWHLLTSMDNEIYNLHPLIRDFVRNKFEDAEGIEELKQAFCEVMVAVAKQIPEQPSSDLIADITPAIAHIEETATTWQDFLYDQDLIKPYLGLGRFYEAQGLYNQAEYWFKQCVSVAEIRLDKNHLDYNESVQNLARFYDSQGS